MLHRYRPLALSPLLGRWGVNGEGDSLCLKEIKNGLGGSELVGVSTGVEVPVRVIN